MNITWSQTDGSKKQNQSIFKKLLSMKALTMAIFAITIPLLVLSLMPNPALRKQESVSANTIGVAIEPEAMTSQGNITISSDSAASNGQYIKFSSTSAQAQ